jgi:hypothetical protein
MLLKYNNLWVYREHKGHVQVDAFWAVTPCSIPRVVTGEKNSLTVAHACRKRRLKWVLDAWEYNWATQSPGDINMETWSFRLGVGAQG